MTSNLNPYELLGITDSSNDFAISHAYRNRIREFKQDRLKAPPQQKITKEKFRLICRAYETLSDHTKRKVYDQTKEWRSSIPVEHYTLQQLVAEPDLFPQLETRLQTTSLKELNEQHPETGHTPLYCAARAGNLRAVMYLTEQGTDLDSKQLSGSTALHVAAFYGHPEVVKCLLESGANYCQRNRFNNLAEIESFGDDTKQAFAELKLSPYVQAAANQLDWFKTNISRISQHIDYQYHALRQTLLHCASKKGHAELVKWLVNAQNANLDIIDVNLNSALHLAAHHGSRAIVKFLLNRGANPLLINKWGMTAEQESFIHGESIRKLFQSMYDRDMFKMAADGVDWWFRYYFGHRSPNSSSKDGVNLLYVACRYGQVLVARWLLENGADVNIRLQDGSRSTPLHGAAYHGHASVVDLLIDHGANLSIRNKFGATALDDAVSDDIKKLLRERLQNLKESRLISVHLYGDGSSSGNEPLVKLQLHCDANFQELIKSMPDTLRSQYQNFSIARRPLNHDDNNISVLTAVCRARCGKSRFIELPLCITAHETARYIHSGHVMSSEPTSYGLREFSRIFESKCSTKSLEVKFRKHNEQKLALDNLLFEFAPKCTRNSLIVDVKYLFAPSFQLFGLPECLCLFTTQYQQHEHQLDELPKVSLTGQHNVRLYTWTRSSPYWFTSTEHERHLPLIGGVHAFINYVDVIPNRLSLPGDMVIQTESNRPLLKRQHPVPCRYVKICEHNTSVFPHIAYHGTTISVVRSILLDGLVMPSTVVSSGIRVCPPSCHIPRGKAAFGIPDFANAIFLSPSIHYCSDPCYAVTFSLNDELLIPVLECSVKNDSYRAFPSTVPNYKPHPDDDVKAIEWRITNPAAIEILSVLFIPKVKSRQEAAKLRTKKLGVDLVS